MEISFLEISIKTRIYNSVMYPPTKNIRKQNKKEKEDCICWKNALVWISMTIFKKPINKVNVIIHRGLLYGIWALCLNSSLPGKG